MARLAIKESTLKILFGRSGNLCAFPSCNEPIIKEHLIVGEICHIEAANVAGPRYNPEQNDENRRSYENLMLLCRNHHKLTDDTATYSIKILKEMKNLHEKKFSKYPLTISEAESKDLFISSLVRDLNISGSNITLLKSLTNIPREGNPKCWTDAYFKDEDIWGGMDARRPIIDELLNSLESKEGVIILDDSFKGKTLILKRVSIELVNKNHIVLFIKDVGANSNVICELIHSILEATDSNLYLVADDVHRSGNEEIFTAINNLNLSHSGRFCYLVAARKEEFENQKNNFDWDHLVEFERFVSKSRNKSLEFNQTDAVLIFQHAIKVSKIVTYGNNEIIKIGQDIYLDSGGDFFMFTYGIMYFLAGYNISNTEKTHERFIEFHIRQKLKLLDWSDKIAAIKLALLGMFGIELYDEVLRMDGIKTNNLESLKNKGVLIKDDKFRFRHERWALEFLMYIYKHEFGEDFTAFNSKYQFLNFLKLILNQLPIHDIFNIIYGLIPLARNDRFKSVADTILTSLEIPSKLTRHEKADLYCYGLGTFHMKLNDNDNALKYLDQAAEFNPDHFDAWNNRGLVLSYLGQFTKALDSFDKALKINPIHTGVLNNKIRSLVKLKKYPEALACNNKSVILDPRNSNSWNSRGYAYLHMKEWDKALKSFDKAMLLDPNNPDPWENRGFILRIRKELGEALKCYNISILLYPDNAGIWLNKGNLYDDLKQKEKAKNCYTKATKLYPKYEIAWLYLGDVLHSLMKFQEAIFCDTRVISLNPTEDRAYYNRARSRIGNNEIELGLGDLQKAIELKRVWIKISEKDHDFDSVRSNKTYQSLVSRRVNFR